MRYGLVCSWNSATTRASASASVTVTNAVPSGRAGAASADSFSGRSSGRSGALAASHIRPETCAMSIAPVQTSTGCVAVRSGSQNCLEGEGSLLDVRIPRGTSSTRSSRLTAAAMRSG